ncbi:hypothetical protein [Cellulomonas sp. PhB150]|uniref:hypothetical protein n=1 Tax=Cellulomonas sp. PhB150 TaxID=2485188 RepID=UPI000F49919F|nr:hypothetical protein [Cellulomonas sp. PhB150]ROS30710.1 hypothetical protein EDF34_0349 [Cellulomonas sp. PhB150]
MLTLHRALASALTALVGLALVLPMPAATAAEGCSLVEAGVVDGKMTYETVCPGDESGGDETGGGGGGGAPAPEKCDKSVVDGVGDYVFCVGTTACAVNNPSHLDEADWPEDDRPGPDYIYTFKWCTTAAGDTDYGWSWYQPEDQGPSLEELAQQAFGALQTPAFSVAFNPPGRTVVGFPTWFWADTGSAGTLTGSSAGGVVAIAQPAHLEVDPGDGRGVRTCAWTTTESDECSVDYPRSSPGYPARMRLVYDVRFENDGAPLDLAGLPTVLQSPWERRAVPVAEIQSIVTSGS